MPVQYKVSGALFAKDRPNGPLYSGSIEIEGQKYNISLWEKTSKAGNPYLQISEDKKAGNIQGQAPQVNKFKKPVPFIKPSDDMDDDVPF